VVLDTKPPHRLRARELAPDAEEQDSYDSLHRYVEILRNIRKVSGVAIEFVRYVAKRSIPNLDKLLG
jgi:hypothetical protein